MPYRKYREKIRNKNIVKRLKYFKKKIGITFTDEKLLIQAFTHSSYVNEHRKNRMKTMSVSNFLEMQYWNLLYRSICFKNIRQWAEGELTKLRAAIVCEPSLVRFANELSFGSLVLLGKGEEMTGGRERPALLADVFEGLLVPFILIKG